MIAQILEVDAKKSVNASPYADHSAMIHADLSTAMIPADLTMILAVPAMILADLTVRLAFLSALLTHADQYVRDHACLHQMSMSW
jgi:hypothetical protein